VAGGAILADLWALDLATWAWRQVEPQVRVPATTRSARVPPRQSCGPAGAGLCLPGPAAGPAAAGPRPAAGGSRAGRRRRAQRGARREPLPGFAGLVRPAVLRTAQAGEGQGWLLRRHSTLSSEPGDVRKGRARGQGEAMPAVSRFQAAAVGDAVYIHTHRSLEDVLVLDVSDPGAPKLASRPVTGAQGTPMSRRGPFAERRLCLSAWL